MDIKETPTEIKAINDALSSSGMLYSPNISNNFITKTHLWQNLRAFYYKKKYAIIAWHTYRKVTKKVVLKEINDSGFQYMYTTGMEIVYNVSIYRIMNVKSKNRKQLIVVYNGIDEPFALTVSEKYKISESTNHDFLELMNGN